MFDDLDDPIGFTPTEQFRRQVRKRGRQARRRRHLGMLGGGVATLMVGMAIAAGAIQWRVNQIDRVDIQTGPANGDQAAPGVEYIVLVGRDEIGQADTIAVARVDMNDDTIGVMSYPRDLVPVGRERQLREISLDGPAALVEAVWPGADHYVELDFDGFRSMVDAVGGVVFEITTPIRDRGSGLALSPGCQTLDGDAALAFARSRWLEWVDRDGIWVDRGGAWEADPGGDLARVERNQLLLASLAAVGRSTDLSPTRLDDLLSILGDHATIDSDWSTVEMAELAWWLSRLDSDATSFGTLPWVPVTLPNGASALRPDPAAADQLERAFESGDAVLPAEPSPEGPAALVTVPIDGRCA